LPKIFLLPVAISRLNNNLKSAFSLNVINYHILKFQQLIISLLVVFILCISCKDSNKKNTPATEQQTAKATKDSNTTPSYSYYNDSVFYGHKDSFAFVISPTSDSVLSNSYSYYGDSLFRGHKELLTFIIKKYYRDSCAPIIQSKKDLKDFFEGFKNLGDVNGDKKNDSIFILPPLNYCEDAEGQSYYFTDTSLPRLLSGSNCCHPCNFFKVPDIDEDGICEVGFYYSSCTSRYKSLEIYSLKNNQWQQIAASAFDILTQAPDKVRFEDLVRKISRNKFQIKNFDEGKKYWDTVELK
jgi:hypothetical protein